MREPTSCELCLGRWFLRLERSAKRGQRAAGPIGIIIVTAASHVYGDQCFPNVQTPGRGEFLRVAARGLECVSMVLLARVCLFIDEGRVSSLLKRQDALPYWEPCKVCHLARPSGSHHCRVCDVCTHGFDHHCGILGTCVAAGNRWPFIALIASGGSMLMCYAVATFAACRATGGWWCYIPAFLQFLYGGLFMLGLTIEQLGLVALGLTTHTANRESLRAAGMALLVRLRPHRSQRCDKDARLSWWFAAQRKAAAFEV